jgi:hypothetical protein
MTAIIFNTKLSALTKFIQKPEILGKGLTFVWGIEDQKRGVPHARMLFWIDMDTQDSEAVESVINVRYPKDSPFLNTKAGSRVVRNSLIDIKSTIISNDADFRIGNVDTVILKHVPSRQPSEAITMCLPVIISKRTLLLMILCVGAFSLSSLFVVLHSEQCIGNVLKYFPKDFDAGRIPVQNVLHECHSVTRSDKLEYQAATRISSGSKCFAGICGY